MSSALRVPHALLSLGNGYLLSATMLQIVTHRTCRPPRAALEASTFAGHRAAIPIRSSKISVGPAASRADLYRDCKRESSLQNGRGAMWLHACLGCESHGNSTVHAKSLRSARATTDVEPSVPFASSSSYRWTGPWVLSTGGAGCLRFAVSRPPCARLARERLALGPR